MSSTNKDSVVIFNGENWSEWEWYIKNTLPNQSGITQRVYSLMMDGTSHPDRLSRKHRNAKEKVVDEAIKDDDMEIWPTTGCETSIDEVVDNDPFLMPIAFLQYKKSSDTLEKDLNTLAGAVNGSIDKQCLDFLMHNSKYSEYRRRSQVRLMWLTITDRLKSFASMATNTPTDNNLQAAVYWRKYTAYTWDSTKETLTQYYSKCETMQSDMEIVGIMKSNMEQLFASFLFMNTRSYFVDEFKVLQTDDGMKDIKTYAKAKEVLNGWSARKAVTAFCDDKPATLPVSVHISAVCSSPPNTERRKGKRPIGWVAPDPETAAKKANLNPIRRKQAEGYNPLTTTSTSSSDDSKKKHVVRKFCSICGKNADPPHYISECPKLSKELRDACKQSYEERKQSYNKD